MSLELFKSNSGNQFWNEAFDFVNAVDRHWKVSDTQRENKKSLTTDIVEAADNFQLFIEMPGVKEKEISIEFQDHILKVSFQREKTVKSESQKFIQQERNTGAFERKFKLPKGTQGKGIKANLVNGVLEVVILKAEEVKPVKIRVGSSPIKEKKAVNA